MDVVRGHVQTYDWGQIDGLDRWTPATGGPQAELWFGTHPNGPSIPRDGGELTVTMPILTKILAAARPLSIQIHPPADFARVQFDAQQSDPTVPDLLPDPYAKAEILIAIEPFTILEGLRDPATSARILSPLGPVVAVAADALRHEDFDTAIRSVLDIPRSGVGGPARRLPDAMAAAGLPALDSEVIGEVLDVYPDDPGVFVAAMLNARTLRPGQGVYVEPGTVHAYVRGRGVEVMTASDNVLRLGLTSKTVAVDAALGALSVFGQPHPCDPEESDGVRTYAPAGAPFRVDMVEDASFTAGTGDARTVLCLEGSVSAGNEMLAPGDAILLDQRAPDVNLQVRGKAVVARAAS